MDSGLRGGLRDTETPYKGVAERLPLVSWVPEAMAEWESTCYIVCTSEYTYATVCVYECESVWEHTCATVCPSVYMSVRWQTCAVVCTCVCIWGYTYISHGVHICMCVRWGTLVPQCSCGGPRNTISAHPLLPPCFRLCPFCSCLTHCVGTWGLQLWMTCRAFCECSGLEFTSSHFHDTVLLLPWSLHLFRGFTQFTFYDSKNGRSLHCLEIV